MRLLDWGDEQLLVSSLQSKVPGDVCSCAPKVVTLDRRMLSQFHSTAHMTLPCSFSNPALSQPLSLMPERFTEIRVQKAGIVQAMCTVLFDTETTPMGVCNKMEVGSAEVEKQK